MKLKNFIFLLTFFFLLFSGAYGYDITVRIALLMDQPAVGVSCPSGLTVKDAYTLKDIVKTSGKVIVKVYQDKIFVNKIETASKFVYVLTKDFNTPIYLNEVPYRGYYLIGFNENNRLMVVNYVGLEDYLGGVLGGEIISSWPMESIKAQAVAARTYAVHRLKAGGGKYYDMVNNTADQMYLGVKGESPRFLQAIKQTSSQVLARDGKVICAYYHSNSGGYTSDSWMVFKGDTAKLSGVMDPFSQGAPNSYWQIYLSSDTIRMRLLKNGINIGKILSIKPYSRDGAGRVIYLQVDHTGGTTYVFGSDFRRYMGYSEIKSTRFNVKPCNYEPFTGAESARPYPLAQSAMQAPQMTTNIPSTYQFTGAGWGHGVGMCQWGAKKMAEQGYNYKEILRHYYPDASICRVKSKTN